MQRRLAPGQTNIITGAKGSGKTFAAVSLAQHVLEGDDGYRTDGAAVVVTNLLFGRVRAGAMPDEAYPEGVRHADTLADTFRAVGEILKEYGQRDVTILWLLDEAQNFMMADNNMSGENQAMLMFLANTRKFQMCNLFMSPSIGNFVPRVRCFPSPLEPKPGMCNGQWYKDREKAAKYFGGRSDWRDIVFYRQAPQTPYMPVLIHGTPWTRGLYGGRTKAGEYSYDTRSTAGFSLGENGNGVAFDIKSFIDATSKGLSWQLAQNIESFFSRWDDLGGDVPADPNQALYDRLREQCAVIDRMRTGEQPVTWRQIGQWFAEPESTLRLRYLKYVELRERGAGVPDGLRKNDAASVLRSAQDDPLRAGVYIQPNGDPPGGGLPLRKTAPERGGGEAR